MTTYVSRDRLSIRTSSSGQAVQVGSRSHNINRKNMTSKRKRQEPLQLSTTGHVVKFNIGGQRYEVSRSLLQMHPDSMLAKSASDQWQKDPEAEAEAQTEAEIFMERNGYRFQYVLDYIRDGSVTLPITESKEALIKELEYYGIDVSDNTIDDSAMHKAKSFHSLGIAVADLKQTIATLKTGSDRALVVYRCAQIDFHCAQLALDCLNVFLSAGVKFEKGQARNVTKSLRSGNAHLNIVKLRTLLNHDDEKARKGANVHLNAVGLNLSAYQTAKNCSTATLEEIDVVKTKLVKTEE